MRGKATSRKGGYLERPSSWMNGSTSRASTPPAIAAVGNCERDLRWTTINRPDRLGEARRKESSGTAMDGRTVFPALADHRFELGLEKNQSGGDDGQPALFEARQHDRSGIHGEFLLHSDRIAEACALRTRQASARSNVWGNRCGSRCRRGSVSAGFSVVVSTFCAGAVSAGTRSCP